MKLVVFGATGNVGRRVVRGLPAPSLEVNARALIAGVRTAGVRRVLFVGGAGSLEVAPGQALADTRSIADSEPEREQCIGPVVTRRI